MQCKGAGLGADAEADAEVEADATRSKHFDDKQPPLCVCVRVCVWAAK